MNVSQIYITWIYEIKNIRLLISQLISPGLGNACNCSWQWSASKDHVVKINV